jgi:hypothetical protein
VTNQSVRADEDHFPVIRRNRETIVQNRLQQILQPQPLWLPSIEDRFDNVRRDQREPQTRLM